MKLLEILRNIDNTLLNRSDDDRVNVLLDR